MLPNYCIPHLDGMQNIKGALCQFEPLTTQRHTDPSQWVTLKIGRTTTAIKIGNAKTREWVTDKAGRAFAAASGI